MPTSVFKGVAVAGDVFDGVFFVLSFFPPDVFDEIWDFSESDSEGFPTYSLRAIALKHFLVVSSMC